MKRWLMVFLLLMAVPGWAQPYPDTLWKRTYGGAGNEVANVVRQTSDDGFIVAGYTTSYGAGGKDMYVIKTDSLGNLEWEQTYGAAEDEYAKDVREVIGGGYIIGGMKPERAWIVRTDFAGDTLWTKIVNAWYNPQTTTDLVSIIQLSQDTIVAAGSHYYQAYSDQGELSNDYHYYYGDGGQGFLDIESDSNSSLVTLLSYRQLSPHGFVSLVRILWGNQISGLYQTPYECFAASLSSVKSQKVFMLWPSYYSQVSCSSPEHFAVFSWSQDSSFTCIEHGINSGCILAGKTLPTGGDVIIRALDSLGAKYWTKTISLDGNQSTTAMALTGANEYAIAGTHQSPGAATTDIFLIRTGIYRENSGYVELVHAGPPSWGYVAHRLSGYPTSIVFSDVCREISGRVSDNAVSRWQPLPNGDNNDGDSIIFISTQACPYDYSSEDTFWLDDSLDNFGPIRWTVLDSSNTISGPSCTAKPFQLEVFTSQVIDSGVALIWRTRDESYTDQIELLRSADSLGYYETIAQFSSTGIPNEYRYVDGTALPTHRYWYYLADVDNHGRRSEHLDNIISARRPCTWLSSFSVSAAPGKNVLQLTTSYEFGLRCIEILRCTRPYNYQLYHRIDAVENTLISQNRTFVDTLVQTDSMYWYLIRSADSSNIVIYYWDYFDSVTAMEPIAIPSDYSLSTYPNPFNATTNLEFSLVQDEAVKITIFNVGGRLVKTLVAQDYPAGFHRIPFDGSDLPSGLYFARLEAGNTVKTQKMVLLK